MPEPLKNRTQRFAAISFLLCDTDKMECLLFIHGVFGSEDEAKDYTVNTLNDMVYPLPVEVVDMYEWCYPIRMTWENNASSKRVVGLDETCAELLLQESQQQRLEALRHNQNIKEETRKKKEMHQEVQKQICERLQLDDAQFTSILEHPDLGTNEIIRICKIEDEAERHGEVAKALARGASAAAPAPRSSVKGMAMALARGASAFAPAASPAAAGQANKPPADRV